MKEDSFVKWGFVGIMSFVLSIMFAVIGFDNGMYCSLMCLFFSTGMCLNALTVIYK